MEFLRYYYRLYTIKSSSSASQRQVLLLNKASGIPVSLYDITHLVHLTKLSSKTVLSFIPRIEFIHV